MAVAAFDAATARPYNHPANAVSGCLSGLPGTFSPGGGVAEWLKAAVC